MAHQREEPVEDFLEVDQQIPGQNFVCLSFISPEKVLKRRESLLVKESLLETKSTTIEII